MSKVKYQPLGDVEEDDDEGSGLLMSDDRGPDSEGGAGADVKATPARNTADGNDNANSSCIGGGGEGDNGATGYSAYFSGGSRAGTNTTGVWPYNRPCAQQYVGKSQSCMVISGRLSVHAPVQVRAHAQIILHARRNSCGLISPMHHVFNCRIE